MITKPLAIPDVILVEPKLFRDARGYFMELFHGKKYHELGLPETFVQDNLSVSQKGVLRGLHYQLTQPQGKLVQAVQGEIFDVAVDIRQGSPWFGQWVGALLTAENRHQLYIPPGFAHGFCALSDTAVVLYKCTDYYAPQDERGLFWNDPKININWPNMDFILSEKDEKSPTLAELDDKLPNYQV